MVTIGLVRAIADDLQPRERDKGAKFELPGQHDSRPISPGIERYKHCASGWNFYVAESLLALLTKTVAAGATWFMGRAEKANSIDLRAHAVFILNHSSDAPALIRVLQPGAQ